MSANTKIEWCDATANHWAGCTKVSPACDKCYAERMAGRLWGTQWGAGMPRKQFAGTDAALKALDRKAKRIGHPLRVFHNSLSDFFDKEVPVQWRIGALRSMLETPNLIHLLLTKRIGNAAEMLETALRAVHAQREGWRDNYLPNIWIGATIVNQEEADRDIPKLLDVPAAKRFLSMEPLLGPVDLTEVQVPSEYDRLNHSGFYPSRFNSLTTEYDDKHFHQPPAAIDWVIVGGESGPGARPIHPDWARGLRDQCESAGVPFLFKQWGEWSPRAAICGAGQDFQSIDPSCSRWPEVIRLGEHGLDTRIIENCTPEAGEDVYVQLVGKKAAGRLLDGRTWDGVPA